MKNSTISMKALLSMKLSAIEEEEARAYTDSKGNAPALSSSMYFFDYKTLSVNARAFNFAMDKTTPAFQEAVFGEFYSREYAKVNDEYARFIPCNDVYFANAREEYSEEEVTRARANCEEARARLTIARETLEVVSKHTESITVNAIVSAIRGEEMPAKLFPALEAVSKECEGLNKAVSAKYSEEEVTRAHEVMDNSDNFPANEVMKAQEIISFSSLSIEGNLPSMKNLREHVSAFIKAMWKASEKDGVKKSNIECNHSLAVEVFQRSKAPRKLSNKGNVVSVYSSPLDLAIEVVFAVVEQLQTRARKAKEAETVKPAKETPAPVNEAPATIEAPAK